MITGIIVWAHGSRVEAANEAVRAAAEGLLRATGGTRAIAAFLELGEPDLDGAVDELARDGVERIVVIPYFLTLGLHMERDFPRLVARNLERHPGLRIEVTAPLDGHPGLVEILADRFRSVE